MSNRTMPERPTPGRSRTAADQRGPERFARAPIAGERPSAVKVLGATLALLVLLVGVPAALVLLTGAPPIPTHLPSHDDLTKPISTDGLIVVLQVVVWLAWLQFAVCTLVEIIGLVRGRGLPTVVPLSGRSQALARALVGTILVGTSVLGSTGIAQAAGPGDAPHHAVASVTGHPQRQLTEDSSAHASESTSVHGESERMAYVPGVPASMTEVIGHKVVVVQPPHGHHHDSLWDLAERHLGDGRRWKELYQLNKDRLQPDGGRLELARLIQPGWVLIMPADATGAVQVHAHGSESADRDAGWSRPETLPGSQAEQAKHEAHEATQVQGRTHASPSEAEPTADPGAVETADNVARAITPLLGGGLFSAVVLAGLVSERRRRHSARITDEQAEVEVALRSGADQDRVRRLDRALRGLSAACRDQRAPLPQAYAARVDDTSVELRIAPPMPNAPSPWSVADGGRRWRLDRASEQNLDTGHAPYPGLVCIGRADDGADILIDLESVGGIISVGGAPTVANEVVSAIAVQLATAPWTDRQPVYGYGLTPILTEIGDDSLELVDDLGGLIADWERSLPRRSAEDVLAGRLGRTPGIAPRYLVLGSVPTDDEILGRMTGLGQAGGRGVGVVAAGPIAGARWRMVVDEHGRLSLPLLDVEVEAARLSGSDSEALAGLFRSAREPEPLSGGPARLNIPATGREGDDAHWGTAPVRVGVLGPIEVRAEGELEPARLALVTEMVVFLAVQNAPVHPSVLGASIWPRGVSEEVRDATITRAREWLGKDGDGNYRLQETPEGRLVLSADVAVDWHAFCELIRRSSAAAARDERMLLRRALHLVRGELLTGRPALRYSWLPRTHLERTAADLAVGVAHRLAHLTSNDDPSSAAAACRAGLRIAPTSQLLWRDLLKTGPSDPEGPGTAGLIEELLHVLQRAGAPLEPETEALIGELLPTHEAGHPGAIGRSTSVRRSAI